MDKMDQKILVVSTKKLFPDGISEAKFIGWDEAEKYKEKYYSQWKGGRTAAVHKEKQI